MTASEAFSEMRILGLNERRCIARHDLDFYRGLFVAGIYRFAQKIHLDALTVPLAATVKEHPILAAVIRGPRTEQPRFLRRATVQLDEHVQILGSDDLGLDQDASQVSIDSLMAALAEYAHNLSSPNAEVLPPWKLLVLPIGAAEEQAQRCLIAYVYSHAIGDGTSGVAFHRSFLKALNDQPLGQKERPASLNVVEASASPLPPAIDFPKLLPISWTYLILTLLNGWSLQSWLANLMFNKSQSATWTGSPYIYDPSSFKTALHVVVFDSGTIELVIAACKKHKTKFTGVFHEMIATVLAEQLGRSSSRFTGLTSSIPINLRHLANMSIDAMGVIASTSSFTHEIKAKTEIGSDSFWQASERTTNKLTEAASTLSDQPIGLLKYLSNIRSWMLAKIGSSRETSYELSNIMAFQPIESEDPPNTVLDCMIFSQPGDVVGAAMSVNLVSVKNGPLVVSIAWQVGALSTAATSFPPQQDVEAAERAFVAEMASLLHSAMTDLGRGFNSA